MKTNEKALYPWQEKCLNAWLRNHGRGIVQAVTGSGKTRLALEAIRRLKNHYGDRLRVKIVVPSSGLMWQWRAALLEGETEPEDIRRRIALNGAGYHAERDGLFTIYVINSARYSLARRILKELEAGYSVLLIADECHHYTSEQNRLIFEFLPYIQQKKTDFFSLGLTATLPEGTNGVYLKKVIGPCIYHYGMKQAIHAGTLCKYDIFHIDLGLQPAERAEYQELTDRMQTIFLSLLGKGCLRTNETGAELFEQLRALARSKNKKLAQMAASYLQLSYLRKRLVCLAASRIPCTVKLLKLLQDNRDKTVIFGERISQANQLYEKLSQLFPGKVGRYHSDMGVRANHNTLSRFRDGELRILITCKAMDEGIDIPDITVGIILSGTAMQRQRIQRLGRIVRKAPGKKTASLYYLHVTETSEERIFLPDTDNRKIFELSYDAEKDLFHQEEYELLANRLLQILLKNGADAEHLIEAQCVLEKGAVCGDWKNAEIDFAEMQRQSKTTRDKNYWMCMGKMQKLSRRDERG